MRLRARIERVSWCGVWMCQKTFAARWREAAITAATSNRVKCVWSTVGSSLSLRRVRMVSATSPRAAVGTKRNGIPSARSSSSQTRSCATGPNTASHAQPRSVAARITARSMGTNEPA